MERKKPKLLIIGHARHGKDTFADLVVETMGLKFVSSSEFVGRRCVWPTWGQERYTAFSDCFEDRVNFRSTWFNLISAYNTPDKARTGTEMMKDFDLYVGMRSREEFNACQKKGIFDYIIWVDASARLPLEGKDSNEMTASLADMHIDNNGPEEGLHLAVGNLQKRLHEEGFDVNWIEDDSLPLTENTEVLDPKYTAVEDNSLAVGEEFPVLKAYDEAANEVLAVGTKAIVERSDRNMVVNPTDAEAKAFRSNAVPQSKLMEMYTLVAPKSMECIHSWEQMPENAIRVLDHGFFKVLEIMGSDQTICESARMSYGRGTKKINNDQGLINYLVRNYHTSPLEMGEIRFHIRMPIFVMRQWVRHRTANLNEYSGRYSQMVNLFYTPCNDRIRKQDSVNKQGSADRFEEIQANDIGNDMSKICSDAFDVYENLLDKGVARETARMVLPLSTYTEVVWKLDISNLIKFLRLRDDDHAQWEIRQYAKMVAKAVEEYFPMVYAAYLEARQSQTLTMDEVRTLITGDLDNLSNSQIVRISQLRHDILS